MSVLSQMLVELVDAAVTDTKRGLWLTWAKFCRWFIFCCPYCGTLLRQCPEDICNIVWCPACAGDDLCPGWGD